MRGASKQSDLIPFELRKREATVVKDKVKALANVLIRPSDQEKCPLLVSLELPPETRQQLVQERRSCNLDSSKVDDHSVLGRHCLQNFLGGSSTAHARRQDGALLGKRNKKRFH